MGSSLSSQGSIQVYNGCIELATLERVAYGRSKMSEIEWEHVTRELGVVVCRLDLAGHPTVSTFEDGSSKCTRSAAVGKYPYARS